MHWVDSADALFDFVSFVVAYAPDEFPEEDFLPADQQLDLDRAFSELNRGLDLLMGKLADSNQVENLRKMLSEALTSYRQGDDVKGAHLLQDFRRLAFGRD